MNSVRPINPTDCAIGWVANILQLARTLPQTLCRNLSSIIEKNGDRSKELPVFEEWRSHAQAYKAEAIALRLEFHQKVL